MKSKLYVLLLVIVFLSGCNYEFSETPPADENGNSANVKVAEDKNTNAVEDKVADNDKKSSNKQDETTSMEGETLILESTGETAAYPCNGREVEIGGTANVINLTGECKKLTVTGVSNKITVEKIGEIIVDGVSNKVTYGEGLDGKKPKIKKGGTTPTVEQKETSTKSS